MENKRIHILNSSCLFNGIYTLIVALILYLSCALGRTQQPPINDNFTNRIICTGVTFVITGSTANATMEAFETKNGFWYYGGADPATQSVWYSWAPEQTSLVLVERINSSTNDWNQLSENYQICVFNSEAITNGYSYPFKVLGCPLNQFWTVYPFLAYAGSNYLIGINSVPPSFGFKFTAYPTNAPVIYEHPQSQTVSLGESAFLSARASMMDYSHQAPTNLSAMFLPGLSFYWCRDGIPLPTAPCNYLVLTNVTAQDAGAYTVVASNWTGMATSQVAYLYVTQTNAVPLLSANKLISNGQTEFHLSVAGETGRCYRIESTTDFTSWQRETGFNKALNPTSVIFTTNRTDSLSKVMDATRKFFRFSVYQPSNSICINQLKQIRFSKDCWAAENKRTLRDVPVAFDFIGYDKYLKTYPECPSGGTYTFNSVGETPTCSIPGHELEEPR